MRRVGDRRAENRLIRGDNLPAMKTLEAERFRCVYMDPPFNTGRTFAEYKDARSRDEWLAMMRPRLEEARRLLSADGAIFVEIDDTELGPLQVAMDEIFGARNRVSTVTVVRSASTGHKAKNRGPVNVSDFLLVYAKDRARWRTTPQWRARRGYDTAYSTFVTSREPWTFVPLARKVAEALGFASRRAAVVALGAERFAAELEAFALTHAADVVRFAQPRYEAVSREAQRWIDRSRQSPDEVMRFERPGYKDMLLCGGDRILCLADKVRDGVLVEPLTNVWDDVPFQGIAREGGVVFTRNKKPERLLERVVAMSTEPGDWVLDPFLGSGTTAAVAHKMGRRWVGIEAGDHFDSFCVPRLERVVKGEDPTGITKAAGWKGGGGFAIYG